MVDKSQSKKDEYDYLQFEGDKEIKKLIKDEIIYFSDKIIKINHYGFSQERQVLVTNKALYNLKKKSLKRRIGLDFVRGVTVSLTDEFVVHCNDIEYDYHYMSNRKKKIVEYLAKSSMDSLKKELKLCELEAKSLKNVVTTKKEKKKDIQFSKMPDSGLTSIQKYLYGDKLDASNNNRSDSKGLGRSGTLYSKKQGVEVKLEDFKTIKVLGRGSFGKVCLVEYIPTKEMFAMKSLKKDVLIDQDQIENTLLEKNILQSIDHVFLVGLNFCFQTVERIYFVMPFLRGGELFQHLRKLRIFDEEKVRFYAAQIALALEHLHSHGIVYRDLKPENILLDEQGYLKLADFGMAKKLKPEEKAMSFCGTPEYLAPEIITGEGHNKAADWWSFGILIYEMLCGIPPFYNENLDRMYELIKLSELRFPKKIKISAEAQDLITKFLDRNQNTRLGSKNGLSEFKSHPFFQKIDFQLVQEKKEKAPYVPEIQGKADVRNFDEEFTGESVDASMIPQKNLELIKKNNDKFKDF
jgi:serum/glucocorticoid-regulated kinase 2